MHRRMTPAAAVLLALCPVTGSTACTKKVASSEPLRAPASAAPVGEPAEAGPSTRPSAEAGARLVRAIMHDNEEEALDLVRDMADVDTPGQGGTPLFVTTYRPRMLEVTKALIARGADVHRPGFGGYTPLHNACMWNNAAAAEHLIASGADVHARLGDGSTPLHMAAARFPSLMDTSNACEVLIKHGADINAFDARHMTPLDCARRSLRKARPYRRATSPVIDLLIAAGGKPAADIRRLPSTTAPSTQPGRPAAAE